MHSRHQDEVSAVLGQLAAGRSVEGWWLTTVQGGADILAPLEFAAVRNHERPKPVHPPVWHGT